MVDQLRIAPEGEANWKAEPRHTPKPIDEAHSPQLVTGPNGIRVKLDWGSYAPARREHRPVRPEIDIFTPGIPETTIGGTE